jgi:hypothetical protein
MSTIVAAESEHRAFDLALADIRREFQEHAIAPMVTLMLEEAYQSGYLPLPPLGFCRTEPWYLGDLR